MVPVSLTDQDLKQYSIFFNNQRIPVSTYALISVLNVCCLTNFTFQYISTLSVIYYQAFNVILTPQMETFLIIIFQFQVLSNLIHQGILFICPLIYVWFMYILPVGLVLESSKWKCSCSHGQHKWSSTAEEDWSEVQQTPLLHSDSKHVLYVLCVLSFTLKSNSIHCLSCVVVGSSMPLQKATHSGVKSSGQT